MRGRMFAYEVEGPDGGYPKKNRFTGEEASKRSNMYMYPMKRIYLTRGADWPEPGKKWSKREDEDLLKMGGFGVDWEVVSKSMNYRTSCDCFLRWNKLREEGKKREEEKNREEEKKRNENVEKIKQEEERKSIEEEEKKSIEEEERKSIEEEEKARVYRTEAAVIMLMARVKELEKQFKELQEKEAAKTVLSLGRGIGLRLRYSNEPMVLFLRGGLASVYKLVCVAQLL